MISLKKQALWVSSLLIVGAALGSLLVARSAAAAGPHEDIDTFLTKPGLINIPNVSKCQDMRTFFNAVIFVKYVRTDGSLIKYSNNFEFSVEAFNPYPERQNTFAWRSWNDKWNEPNDPPGRASLRQMTIIRPGVSHYGPGPVNVRVQPGRVNDNADCVPPSGDGRTKQRAYAFRNGEGGSYALSCQGVTRFSAGFEFKMLGNPRDIPPVPAGKTGHWRQSVVRQHPFGEVQADDLNRKQIVYEFKYEIPDNTPPPAATNYVPKSTVNKLVAEPGETVEYTHTLTNPTTLPSPGPEKDWAVIGIKVAPGTSAGLIKQADATGAGYANDNTASSFSTLASLVANKLPPGKGVVLGATPSGRNAFPPTNIPPESIVIPADARVGEKYCRLLAVYNPTGNPASPKYRYSDGVCVTIGKKPKLQVLGGDIFAGRRYVGNMLAPTANAKIVTSTSVIGMGATGRTFGSWGEYGIAAPGAVLGTASHAGLRGGNASSSQGDWSRLTFANAAPAGPGSFGNFYDSTTPASQGTIPDIKKALTDKYPTPTPLASAANVVADSLASGRHESTTDVSLSASTLQAGKSVVIYAPNRTVTVRGNLTNAPGPFTAVDKVPQLVIIAKSIHITDSVTQVDAWLLASDTVDTCSTAPADNRLTSSICSNPLSVTGPIAAEKLLLRRTAGSDSPTPEGRSAPAETLNLRADAYLWAYSLTAGNQRTTTTYTKELAPRF